MKTKCIIQKDESMLVKISYFVLHIIIVLLLVSIKTNLDAQEFSAKEILKRVDENLTAESRIASSSMTIHGRRSSRTVRAKSWVKGTEKSFTEYLAPPREKGTKMLKLEDELWIYLPAQDRTIQISGHMLREPVMGSDLSYEDFMEDPILSNIYTPKIESSDSYMNRECWVLYLSAKEEGLAYNYRRLWIDKERFLPLKEEWFGAGETLLKTVEVQEVKQQQGRWYPSKTVYNDVLKAGDGTMIIIEEIQFDVNIPEHRFSRAALN